MSVICQPEKSVLHLPCVDICSSAQGRGVDKSIFLHTMDLGLRPLQLGHSVKGASVTEEVFWSPRFENDTYSAVRRWYPTWRSPERDADQGRKSAIAATEEPPRVSLGNERELFLGSVVQEAMHKVLWTANSSMLPHYLQGSTWEYKI
jgi:hypothetical protein